MTNDMKKMQEEAVKTVREIHKKSKFLNDDKNAKHQKVFKNKSYINAPSMPLSQILFKDSERSLILILIILLIDNEENLALVLALLTTLM